MDQPSSPPVPEAPRALPPRLVDQPEQLAQVVEACASTPRITLDIEGNGLHAYRSQLCVLQLGWLEGDRVAVAIVDPLALSVAPLADLLGSAGPVKILHDLTFDARMLIEAGVELGNVRDTSVAARFLGEPATGLGALVSARLGIELDKQLQDHDWALRPFSDEQLGYLAGDVRYLLALEDELSRSADEQGIAAEIAVECRYKLAGALAPPQDQRPSHLRLKGYAELGGPGQAVARRLVMFRDELAQTADVPPFRIAPNALLVALARRKPRDAAQLRRSCGNRRRLRGDPKRWLAAVRQGLDDGAPPADEPAGATPMAVSGREIAHRKRLSKALSAWRRKEAKQRGVDVQVVLPGHCVGPLVGELAAASASAGDGLHARLAAVDGLGQCRLDRYEQAWSVLAQEAGTGGHSAQEGEGTES